MSGKLNVVLETSSLARRTGDIRRTLSRHSSEEIPPLRDTQRLLNATRKSKNTSFTTPFARAALENICLASGVVRTDIVRWRDPNFSSNWPPRQILASSPVSSAIHRRVNSRSSRVNCRIFHLEGDSSRLNIRRIDILSENVIVILLEHSSYWLNFSRGRTFSRAAFYGGVATILQAAYLPSPG